MVKYRAIKVDGEKHDYHRYIIEQHLGRKLERSEVVHHINGNPRDNRIENLAVMSLSEHTSLHSKGHVTSEELKLQTSMRMKGKPSKCRKLTNEQVEYIRKNCIRGDKNFGVRALGNKFGVSHSQISEIINNKQYTSSS